MDCVDDDIVIIVDPLEEWFQRNPDVEESTRGKFVGFTTNDGVIAAADSRRQLRSLLVEFGFDPVDVLIVSRSRSDVDHAKCLTARRKASRRDCTEPY